VQAVLAERGTITNAEVRRLSGYSRTEVVRLMRSLVEEETAILRGRGRAARYEPGRKLAVSRPRRRSTRRE
jgi:DNA-binding IclR family transcriptional regulator